MDPRALDDAKETNLRLTNSIENQKTTQMTLQKNLFPETIAENFPNPGGNFSIQISEACRTLSLNSLNHKMTCPQHFMKSQKSTTGQDQGKPVRITADFSA